MSTTSSIAATTTSRSAPFPSTQFESGRDERGLLVALRGHARLQLGDRLLGLHDRTAADDLLSLAAVQGALPARRPRRLLDELRDELPAGLRALLDRELGGLDPVGQRDLLGLDSVAHELRRLEERQQVLDLRHLQTERDPGVLVRRAPSSSIAAAFSALFIGVSCRRCSFSEMIMPRSQAPLAPTGNDERHELRLLAARDESLVRMRSALVRPRPQMTSVSARLRVPDAP